MLELQLQMDECFKSAFVQIYTLTELCMIPSHFQANIEVSIIYVLGRRVRYPSFWAVHRLASFHSFILFTIYLPNEKRPNSVKYSCAWKRQAARYSCMYVLHVSLIQMRTKFVIIFRVGFVFEKFWLQFESNYYMSGIFISQVRIETEARVRIPASIKIIPLDEENTRKRMNSLQF